MTVETHEYRYVLNAGQAKQELAALGASMDKVASPAQGLWAKLNTVEGKVVTLGQQAKMLQQKMGPTAAAISGVSSALGENAGAAGKAIAATGQLVGAFAAGGPLGLAIAGTTLAVNQLSAAWEREIKAQDAAIEKQFAAANAAISGKKAIEDRLELLKKEQLSLTNGGRSGSILDIKERYAAEIAAQQKVAEQLNTQLMLRGDIAQEDYAQLTVARKNIELLREAQRIEIENFKARRSAGSQASKPSGGGGARSGSSSRFGFGEHGDRVSAALGDQNKIAAQQQKAFDDVEKIVLERRADAENARTAIAAEGAAARKAIAEQEMQDQIGIANTVIGIVSSTSQQFLADMISGQEHAAERFGISIMQQAGQALVSYGTQAIGRGILEASSPLTAPLAPASFAAGGVLLGAGIGLGGLASGLGANLGGGSGGSSDAAKERGASSSRSPSPERGAGTTINITYGGASGPTAEDGAKAVEDALDRAERRSGRRKVQVR